MAEIKRRKTRMYEPWGYRDQNDYQGVGDVIATEMNEFVSNVIYNESAGTLVFVNDEGEEKATIDVTKFAQSHVDHTEFDKDTKIYYIYYTNGDVVELDMSDLIDVSEAGDGLTADTEGKLAIKLDDGLDTGEYLTVGPDGLGVTSAITNAFTDAELNWEADANGFNIDYFNSKTNKMDTVKLFDTDANGNVHIGPGANGPGF